MLDNQTTQSLFLKAYEENADALFRFAYFRTQERERAVDLVQDTYLRVWGYVAKGNTIDEFRAFLFRTLRNTIIDSDRQRAVRNTDSLDEHIEHGQEFAEEKTKEEYDTFDLERVLKLLNALEPETYRDAVHLRYIEGLSPKEVAGILGVSENVAAVRVNRGIKKLQKLFAYDAK